MNLAKIGVMVLSLVFSAVPWEVEEQHKNWADELAFEDGMLSLMVGSVTSRLYHLTLAILTLWFLSAKAKMILDLG
jgi:hypothetical protein